MRVSIFFVNLFNFIFVVSLIVFFSLTFLNFTFTFSDLPDDNVPYYISDDAANVTEKNSGKFGLYWWIYASQVLLLLIPLLLLSNLLILHYGGTGFTVIVQFIFVLLLLWELTGFIWAVLL
ncbi:hypothetical protein LCGC14_2718440, partial [marine sediment metagenome]